MYGRRLLGAAGALAVAVVPVAAGLTAAHAAGGNLSGAIFTTVSDGTEVNFNIYPNKEAVYLDGGPGPGAPQTAAGLPAGSYYFQVTDPSGKSLLSTDAVMCREVAISGGIITGLVHNGCDHVTGTDVDHGATTVQLMPYLDTPNHGDEYKVWLTPIGNYGCAPTSIDCNAGGKHGFIPRYSKTDNYKTRGTPLEIDTRFYPAGADGSWIDGLSITHTDTLGATNVKFSYWDPSHSIFHEAHVEDVESGSHFITIDNQPGCTIGHVVVNGVTQSTVGPQTVEVVVRNNSKVETLRVDVECV